MKHNAIPRVLATTALAVVFVSGVAPSPVPAQRRIVEDTSTVKVQQRAPRTITRGPSQVATAQVASNGVLVVLTDPPGAQILIDGKPVGTSDANGEFTRELRAGREYAVKVSAGDEFEPFNSRVRLLARKTEIVKAPLVNINASKFALLKIGFNVEGAKVYVDGAKEAWKNVTFDKDVGFYLVDGLPPGSHKVVVDHPDYMPIERALNTVKAGDEIVWAAKQIPAVTALTVKTEALTKVYVDGEFRGETPDNGTLEIPDVRLGTREVKLVKDGYVELKDTKQFDFGKPVAFTTKLVPLPTSAEFSDDFDINLTKWTQTAGLSIKSGRLMVAKADALCVAKNTTYRDFVMAFHLRLENGGGAAWAVRAKDPNDYYLFYVSGPTGMFPGRFNTYIVKDGTFDPTNPIQSVPVITNFKAKGEYQVEIHGTKDVIEHMITPADTGKSEPLGVFQDPNKTYTYGGIGFRTVGDEQFSVDELFVQPRGN